MEDVFIDHLSKSVFEYSFLPQFQVEASALDSQSADNFSIEKRYAADARFPSNNEDCSPGLLQQDGQII